MCSHTFYISTLLGCEDGHDHETGDSAGFYNLVTFVLFHVLQTLVM